ncbi:MAG: N-acetyltransferase family protein [Oligoflexales bacterium]
MNLDYEIIPNAKRWYDYYVEHIARHYEEQANSEFLYTPMAKPHLHNLLDAKIRKWGRPLTETQWERSWIVVTRDSKVVGHVDLSTSHMEATRHRALLSMGIETDYRRKGLGLRLCNEAIKWARTIPGLSWIDLSVFAHNLPAIRLYERLGFIKGGVVEDMFRVQGQRINDIQMALRL